jgi:hypothetical protein
MIHLDYSHAIQYSPTADCNGKKYIVYNEDGDVWIAYWIEKKQAFIDSGGLMVDNVTWFFQVPHPNTLLANYGKEE